MVFEIPLSFCLGCSGELNPCVAWGCSVSFLCHSIAILYIVYFSTPDLWEFSESSGTTWLSITFLDGTEGFLKAADAGLGIDWLTVELGAIPWQTWKTTFVNTNFVNFVKNSFSLLLVIHNRAPVTLSSILMRINFMLLKFTVVRHSCLFYKYFSFGICEPYLILDNSYFWTLGFAFHDTSSLCSFKEGQTCIIKLCQQMSGNLHSFIWPKLSVRFLTQVNGWGGEGPVGFSEQAWTRPAGHMKKTAGALLSSHRSVGHACAIWIWAYVVPRSSSSSRHCLIPTFTLMSRQLHPN